MKTLVSACLLLQVGFACADSPDPSKPQYILVQPDPFGGYAYVGYGFQSDDGEQAEQLPAELRLVFRDGSESGCYKKLDKQRNPVKGRASFASAEIAIRGAHYLPDSVGHNSSFSEPSWALAFTVCDSSENYWTLEGGSSFDDGTDEVANQSSYLQLRFLRPTRYGWLEANLIHSRYSDVDFSDFDFTVGYKSQYKRLHWGVDLGASKTVEDEYTPTVSLSFSIKTGPVYWNVLGTKGLSGNDNGTYAEAGVQLPF